MTNNSKQCCFTGNTRGFTLIEILIAVAIFSIGILGVAKLQLWNVKNTTTGNLTTNATMLARAKIEELKGTDGVTSLTSGADPDPLDANGNPGGIFSRSWTVDPEPPTGPTCKIEVTVSWTRQGQNRRVVLTTITRGNGT